MTEIRLIDANALKYKNLAEVNDRLTYKCKEDNCGARLKGGAK